jgi:hypothetical protein
MVKLKKSDHDDDDNDDNMKMVNEQPSKNFLLKRRKKI